MHFLIPNLYFLILYDIKRFFRKQKNAFDLKGQSALYSTNFGYLSRGGGGGCLNFII